MAPPTSNRPDQELLDCYVKEQSERAFTALVERYSSMVFVTALKKTGDRQTAEEISQDVFTVFARKAGSVNGHSIASWLYRATMFECSRALKKRTAHRRKMDALSQDYDENQGRDSQVPDPMVQEALGQALGRLSSSDQNIVLLRFYGDLSFREIGSRVGKSEDASQKQASRALEKLRRSLRHRGIALPVSALASTLTVAASTGAPAGLAKAIAQNALANAPTLTKGALTLHTLTIMTTGSVAKYSLLAGLAAAIHLGIQQWQIESNRTELKALVETKFPGGVPEAEPSTDLSHAPQREIAPNQKVRSADQWIDGALSGGHFMEASRRMSVLSPDEQGKLLSDLEAHPGIGEAKDQLIAALLYEIGKRSPREGLEHRIRLGRGGVWQRAPRLGRD